MIDPLTMMAIAGGAKALLGAGQAIAGGIGMGALKRREPKYEIPKEVGEAVGLAKSMAQEGMPEAQRMAAQQDILQSSLMFGRSDADRRAGLMMTGTRQAQVGRSLLNLAAMDAQKRQENQRMAYSALMAGAGFREKQQAANWQSWMNEMQRKRSFIGAGIANIGGGFDLFGSGAAMALKPQTTTTDTSTTV